MVWPDKHGVWAHRTTVIKFFWEAGKSHRCSENVSSQSEESFEKKAVYLPPVERHGVRNRPPVSLSAHFIFRIQNSMIIRLYPSQSMLSLKTAYLSCFERILICRHIFRFSSAYLHLHAYFSIFYCMNIRTLIMTHSVGNLSLGHLTLDFRVPTLLFEPSSAHERHIARTGEMSDRKHCRQRP